MRPAVVVGSGPNGLCAAIALARAGREVLVVEGSDSVGGGCRSGEHESAGFVHDHCSAIHPMALLSDAICALPLAEHGLRWVHADAPLAHPFDDGTALVLEKELGANDPAWQAAFDPFVSRARELFADALAPPGVPSSPLLMARFGIEAIKPATSFANHFADRRLRALFGGLAGHSVLPLDAAGSSAIGLALTVAAHHVGWPFPEGGAGALTRALVSYLESLGGELSAGRWVESLDDLPTGADVFFDTSPQALSRIAGDALPASYRRRLEAFEHGPGLCKVDYALSEAIPWRSKECGRAATVHLGGSIDELVASERACWEGRHVEKPLVLLTQCSLFDRTRSPEGKHTAWAYCHVPASSSADRTAVIEAQIERFAPGFSDIVIERHTTTAAELQTLNPNYIGGDVNGGAATLGQLFTRPVARWSPWTTPNARLFLCSASTPPGGGVHGLCGLHAVAAAG